MAPVFFPKAENPCVGSSILPLATSIPKAPFVS